jgi:transposase-like protein
VLLFAPDGLFINPLYLFASGTKLGRTLFHFVNRHPSALFKTADALKFVRILPPKLHRFVYVHMDSQKKRNQVYMAWMAYRWFRPNQGVLVKEIQAYQIGFNMLFGKYDSIIRPSLGRKFAAKLENTATFHELHIGHRMLHPNTLNYIKSQGLI